MRCNWKYNSTVKWRFSKIICSWEAIHFQSNHFIAVKTHSCRLVRILYYKAVMLYNSCVCVWEWVRTTALLFTSYLYLQCSFVPRRLFICHWDTKYRETQRSPLRLLSPSLIGFSSLRRSHKAIKGSRRCSGMRRGDSTVMFSLHFRQKHEQKRVV